jgi:hypothetical protein
VRGWPRLQPAKLKEVDASDLVVRFAFGALISVVASVVSLWNAKAGGMFLAFPAILPATLTLIEKKQSKQEAEEDVEGATLGAVAMFAFAATATWALTALPAGLSLAAASGAWLTVAALLYVVVVARAQG